MKTAKKRHPFLLLLDIIIVILTIALAVTVIIYVKDSADREGYRLSPETYSHTLQTGDYRSLTQSFYLASYQPILEEEITPELRPYASVAGYYLDRFVLGIYQTMDDAVRTEQTLSQMEQDRQAMSFFLPEADKIDKIFDSVRR